MLLRFGELSSRLLLGLCLCLSLCLLCLLLFLLGQQKVVLLECQLIDLLLLVLLEEMLELFRGDVHVGQGWVQVLSLI